MIRWTLTFLVAAIIAAVAGFGGFVLGAASIARLLCYLFLLLFIISLLAGGYKKAD